MPSPSVAIATVGLLVLCARAARPPWYVARAFVRRPARHQQGYLFPIRPSTLPHSSVPLFNYRSPVGLPPSPSAQIVSYPTSFQFTPQIPTGMVPLTPLGMVAYNSIHAIPAPLGNPLSYAEIFRIGLIRPPTPPPELPTPPPVIMPVIVHAPTLPPSTTQQPSTTTSTPVHSSTARATTRTAAPITTALPPFVFHYLSASAPTSQLTQRASTTPNPRWLYTMSTSTTAPSTPPTVMLHTTRSPFGFLAAVQSVMKPFNDSPSPPMSASSIQTTQPPPPPRPSSSSSTTTTTTAPTTSSSATTTNTKFPFTFGSFATSTIIVVFATSPPPPLAATSTISTISTIPPSLPANFSFDFARLFARTTPMPNYVQDGDIERALEKTIAPNSRAKIGASWGQFSTPPAVQDFVFDFDSPVQRSDGLAARTK